MRTQQVTIEGKQVNAIVIETSSKVYTAVTAEDSHKVSSKNRFTVKSK